MGKESALVTIRRRARRKAVMEKYGGSSDD